jgi:hypothetical protein
MNKTSTRRKVLFMRKIGCILIAITLSVGAAAQYMQTPPYPLTWADRMQETQLTAEEQNLPTPQRGEEKLDLTTTITEIRAGSIVDLIVLTKNQSNHSIRELRVRGFNPSGAGNVGIQIKDSLGTIVKMAVKPLPKPIDSHHFVTTMNTGSSVGYSKIVLPGQTIWEPYSINLKDYDLVELGTYTLQAYTGADFEHAEAKSNVLTIKVLPKVDVAP